MLSSWDRPIHRRYRQHFYNRPNYAHTIKNLNPYLWFESVDYNLALNSIPNRGSSGSVLDGSGTNVTKTNGIMNFDGSNSLITVTQASQQLSNLAEYTVCALVNFRTVGESNNGTIYEIGTGGVNKLAFNGASFPLRGIDWDGANPTALSDTNNSQVAINTWYWLFKDYSNSGDRMVHLYKAIPTGKISEFTYSQQLAANGTRTIIFASFTIGARVGGLLNWDGFIKSFMMFNRVLTTAEKNLISLFPATGYIVNPFLADDTSIFQALINAGNVTIPGGFAYTITREITVPANRTIDGTGKLIFSGVQGGSIYPGNPTYRNLLNFTGGNVTIKDITIEGENEPFDGQYVQNQNAALWFPHGRSYGDILIENVKFNNLYGFPLAGSITANSCLIQNNTVNGAGNGFNINCDGAIYLNNQLIDCEGIEAAGGEITIQNNVLNGCLGLAIGGFVSPPTLTTGVVSGNTINNAHIAIIAAEYCSGVTIENNTIDHAHYGILSAASVEGSYSEDLIIQNNNVNDIYQSAPFVAGGGIAIYGDSRNTLIDSNTVTNAHFGLEIRAETTTASNNVLEANELDIYIQAGIDDTVLTNNTYTTCSGC